jgi:hypothetical protein
MFYCEFCGELAAPRTPCRLVVVETRLAQFPPRPRANPTPHLTPKYRDDPGGRGRQIVRERRACPRCAATVVPERNASDT